MEWAFLLPTNYCSLFLSLATQKHTHTGNLIDKKLRLSRDTPPPPTHIHIHTHTHTSDWALKGKDWEEKREINTVCCKTLWFLEWFYTYTHTRSYTHIVITLRDRQNTSQFFLTFILLTVYSLIHSLIQLHVCTFDRVHPLIISVLN